jgi:hypothetical protein
MFQDPISNKEVGFSFLNMIYMHQVQPNLVLSKFEFEMD